MRARGLIRTFTATTAAVVLIGILGLNFLHPAQTKAATSDTVNFQARLELSSGAMVPDGNYNVRFKLYNVSTAGTALWTETYQNSASQGIRVDNGYLTANLGSITAFPAINWDQQLWLTMDVGGTSTGPTPTYDGEMTPRLKLTAVPYAFRAGKLAKLTGANTSILDWATQTAANNLLLPDESGTLCVRSSANCNFAAASGSSNYIQNGTSPQTADFNITGNGRAAILNGTTGINTGAGAGTQRIDSSGNLVNIGTITAAGQLALSVQGSTGGLLIGGDGTLYRSGSNALTTGGALTVTNGLTVSNGGQDITLNGATSNYINYGNNGVAAPTFTTRSAGTKLVLYDQVGASSADYAIGIEAATLWNSVAGTSAQFKWYGGTTQAAVLSGTGNLTLGTGSGTLTSGNINGQTVSSTANFTGTLAVSGAVTLSSTLTQTVSQVNASGNLSGTSVSLTHTPSSAPSSSTSDSAISGTAISAGSNVNGFVTAIGVKGVAANTSTTGTLGTANGLFGQVFSANNITSASGLTTSVFNNGTGTFTNAYGVNVGSALANSGAITTAYGINIAAQAGTGVGTGYGIYQAGASDLNVFAGATTLQSTLGVTGAITGSSTIQGTTINATTAFTLGGANINTAGTLNNVAYLNQANNFSVANTFSAAGTALSVTNNASIGGTLTVPTIQNSSSIAITSGTTLSLTSTGSNAININPGGTSNTGVQVRPGTDSTVAFQVQNSTGANILNADTATKVITIAGSGTGTAKIGSIGINNFSGISLNGTLDVSNFNFLSSPTDNSQNLYINRPTGGAINFVENNGTVPQLALSSGGAATFRNTTNSITGFQVQNTSAASLLTVDTSTSSNLVTNGDIEGGTTTGWAAKSGATLSQVTTQQWQGNNSLSVATTIAANDGAKYTGFTLVQNTQYTFSFYAKVASGTITDVNIGHQNNTTNGEVDCLTGRTFTTSWTRFTCTFTDNTIVNTNYLYVKKTGTAAETFFIDGVQLQTGASTTPFNAGGAVQLSGVVNSPISFQNKNDSTTAFQIQNSAGTSNLFVADTTNGMIGTGAAPALFGGRLQVTGNTISTSTTYENLIGLGGTDGIIGEIAHRSNGTQSYIGIDAFNAGNTVKTSVVLQEFGGSVGIGTNSPISGVLLDVAGDINVSTGSAYKINGVSINTAGTLNNVAYLNQANTFSAANTFSVGGQAINFTNATSNYINYGTNGVAAPTVTSRSNGTKIVLYNSLSGSLVDFAIGIESSTLWNSVGGTANQFKWYGGTTQAALLTGGGNLTLGTGAGTLTSGAINGQTISSTASFSGTLQVNGTSGLVGNVTLGSNLLSNNSATATTGTTSGTGGSNVTTITLAAAGSFANNDIIFVDNTGGSGQDYYTRIVSGGGTTTLTISPAVSYGTAAGYTGNATITKYTGVSNLGATSSDYTTLSNRFFQGYFLGGVVTGAGSTSLSDGSLQSSTYLNINAATASTISTTAGNLTLQGGSGTVSLGLSTTLTATGTLSVAAGGVAQNLNLDAATTGAVNIGNTSTGNVLLAGGSAATGCTVTNATGDLACTGNITGSATGTVGFFSRSGVTIQPATAGDSITTSGNLSTTSSGTITSAGLLTGSAGLTVSGAAVSLNASSNFATNINTGTSTGAVSIGNSAAGAVAITSGSTVSLTSTGSNAINITPGGGTNTGVLVKPAADSTAAFQVQNATGTQVLGVDTTSQRVNVGTLGTPTGQLYVSGKMPTATTATLSSGGNLWQASVTQGRYLYMADYGGSNLIVFDISVPAAPVVISTTSAGVGSGPQHLAIAGHYVYIAGASNNKLIIMDVSNPKAPVVTSSVTVGSVPNSVYVQGKYAYVANVSSSFISVVDISNPAAPIVSNVATATANFSVSGQGKYIYAVNDAAASSLVVYDASNPTSMTSVGSVSLGGAAYCGAGGDFGGDNIAILGRYAYVTQCTTNAIKIVDISTPTAPTVTSTISTGANTGPFTVKVNGKYLYSTLFNSHQLGAYDISVPASPVTLGTVSTGGAGSYSLSVQGRYVYPTDFHTLDVFDMGGAYVQQLEVGGVETGTIFVNGTASVASDISVGGGGNFGRSVKIDDSLAVNGSATFANATNSTTAFQVQNATGAAILLVDTTSTAANGTSVNYLSYPGFESGSFSSASGGWAPVSPATLTQNTTKTHTYNGLYSAQVTTTATNGGLTTSSFTSAPPSGNYIVSFYAKVSSGTIASSAFVVQTTDTGTHTCSPAAGTTINSSGFQRVFCTVSPIAAVTALQITQNDGTARTIYIDGVQMQSTTFNGGAITAPTPYQIGGIMLRGVIQNPLVIQPNSDSTSIFQIYNAAGTNSLVNVDTLNSTVSVGTVGSIAQASTTNISTSTGAIQTVNIGSTNSSSATTINGGSGNVLVNATSGTVTLQTTTSGAINIKPAGTSNVVIGTSDAVGTLVVLDTDNDTTETTEVDGGMYYNSSMRTFRCGAAGIWSNCGGFTAGITNASGIGASSITEAAFTTTAATDQTFTIPANFCQPGRVITIHGAGYYTTGAASNVTFRTRLDSVSGTVMGASIAAGPAAAVSNMAFKFDQVITCKTTTTVDAQGWFWVSTAAANTTVTEGPMWATTPPADITITTAAHAIVPTATFSVSNATNLATLRQFTVTANGP